MCIKLRGFEMTKGEDVSSNRKHNTERNKNDPGTRKELYKRVNQRQEMTTHAFTTTRGSKRRASENSVT